MNDSNLNNEHKNEFDETDKNKDFLPFEDNYENPYEKFISRDSDSPLKKTGSDDIDPYKPYVSKNTEYKSNDSQVPSDYEGAEPKEFRVQENICYEPATADATEQPLVEEVIIPTLDEAKEKRHFSCIGIGFMLFSVISFAISLVIQIIALSIDPDIYSSSLFINLITPVSLYLFALPVLLLMLSRCEGKVPEKKRMGFGRFMLFLIVAFGFMYIGAIVGNTFMDILSGIMNFDYSNGLGSIIDDDNIWITAIFTVIVAPIGEEFVFRKLIIDRTYKYGPFISIGLSGLMFGLMHANFYQFFYCFAIGLLLGYVYYSTGKLHLTIIIHAVVNFFGSVVSSWMAPLIEKMSEIDPAETEAMATFLQENILGYIGILLFDAFVYAAMPCAIIFPIVFRRRLKSGLAPAEILIPKRRFFPVVIFNVGIILMFAFYFLEFGLNLIPA